MSENLKKVVKEVRLSRKEKPYETRSQFFGGKITPSNKKKLDAHLKANNGSVADIIALYCERL